MVYIFTNSSFVLVSSIVSNMLSCCWFFQIFLSICKHWSIVLSFLISATPWATNFFPFFFLCPNPMWVFSPSSNIYVWFYYLLNVIHKKFSSAVFYSGHYLLVFDWSHLTFAPRSVILMPWFVTARVYITAAYAFSEASQNPWSSIIVYLLVFIF